MPKPETSCYIINSFTDQPDGGNPAAVIPLSEWLPTAEMQEIARQKGVAETAFFIQTKDHFGLRWFTPEIEMDLCGHATLASAFVIKEYIRKDLKTIIFDSASGRLMVHCADPSRLIMDLPSRPPVPAELPAVIQEAMNIQPRAVLKSRDYLLIYDTEEEIRAINPDREVLDRINLDPGGVIVTAPGERVDFVSRFFTPQSSIFEDPVTGSAHCSLIPYWSKVLDKEQMSALQLSERQGTLDCTDSGDRVLVGGQCYLDVIVQHK